MKDGKQGRCDMQRKFDVQSGGKVFHVRLIAIAIRYCTVLTFLGARSQLV